MGKKCPNTLNHGQGHLKETKHSIPHFAFNEVSLMSRSQLKLELYLFWVIWDIKAIFYVF